MYIEKKNPKSVSNQVDSKEEWEVGLEKIVGFTLKKNEGFLTVKLITTIVNPKNSLTVIKNCDFFFLSFNF